MIILCFLTLLSCSLSLSYQVQHSALGKVDVIHNPSYRAHRPSQYLRTLSKYKITPTHPEALPVHELVSPDGRVLRRDINLGLISATFDESNAFYRSPLTIGEGSQAKTLNLQFDTGSADLWVFSTLIPPGQRGNKTLYDPTNSNTSIPLQDSFNVAYADTSGASGLVFNDTVAVGGIIFKNQAVEAANQTKGFLDFDSDGLLGLALGPNTISPDVLPTFVQNLIQNPEVNQSVFTALLTRPSEPPGFFTFGYINDTLSQSGVQFIELASIGGQIQGSWEILSTNAFLNEKGIFRSGNTAVVDTGTSGIFLEDNLVQEIYQLLNGHYDNASQIWVFPANTTNFPILTLPAGNVNVTLTPADFSIGPPDGGFLGGSIQERGDMKVDIFGTSWLNNIYAVFDLGLTGPGITRFGLVPRD